MHAERIHVYALLCEQQELDEWLLSVGLRNNLEEQLINKYILSWYFINTIFSTVGFGDIHPETQAERAFLVWWGEERKDTLNRSKTDVMYWTRKMR